MNLDNLVTHIDKALETLENVNDFTKQIEQDFKTAIRNKDLLCNETSTCCPEGYKRHVLHLNEERPYTLMSLVWRPEQGSPVHGHKSWCVVGVIEGELTIESYTKNADGSLSLDKEYVAQAGETCIELPDENDIHRIINKSGQKAVSLHIYGMDLSEDPGCINKYYEFGDCA